MIVESIHVQNFLSHTDSTVHFNDARLWLITGENGAGKSSLFDALEFALYGTHRGGDTTTSLLIKRGVDRATVRVVVQLQGERYQVTQRLDMRRGNLGGELARWSPALGTWTPVNAGAGVRAVWEWLEQRLPPHHLFCSAIYLRQNQTAAFLSGSAADRLKRFSDLIDLSRYTELGDRAKRKQREREQSGEEANGRLKELGDISETVAQRLQAQIALLDDHLTAAHQVVEFAAGRTLGAREWSRLNAERCKLLGEHEAVRELMAEESIIREADERVRRWDRDSVRLEAHWRLRREAAEHRQAAAESLVQAQEAAEQRDVLQTELEGALTRQHDVAKEMATAGEMRSAAEGRLGALALEADIAAARAALGAAELTVTALAGADTELAVWEKREAAHPLLTRVVRERDEVVKDEQALREAREAVTCAEECVTEAAETAKAAEEQQASLRTALETAQQRVTQLTAAEHGLEARVAGRSRLEGVEERCPVCDQPLSTEAHEHVRQTLASERERLEQVRRELGDAQQGEREANKQFNRADREAKRLSIALETAKRDFDLAAQRVQHADRALERSRRRLTETLQEVGPGCPGHQERLDRIDSIWLAEERLRLDDGLPLARERADALRKSQRARDEAGAHLQMLRGRREPDALPVGDQRTEPDVRTDVAQVERDLTLLGRRLADLEEETREFHDKVRCLSREIGSLGTRREFEAEAAGRAQEGAERAEKEAGELLVSLAPLWGEVVREHERYEVERESIGALRTVAARESALREAPGKLAGIEEQLMLNQEAVAGIPAAHRVAVEDAEHDEQVARDQEINLRTDRDGLVRQRADLEDRRERAQELQREIRQFAKQAVLFGELVNLLKEGGPIQTEIASREQLRIVQEVNQVLETLGDALRVTLRPPRRKGGARALQDLAVVDTSDPLNAPCYFEFLSGGEQFRVALALALALHRRVAGGNPGTLIVDEGFGALDTKRRDALAVQMTADVSHGILSLGLAERIVICSHAAEVQRHFSNRWHITKRDGTASVSRETEE